MTKYISCSDIIEVLKGGEFVTVGETSKKKIDLPLSYVENERKFVEDSSTSLDNHTKEFRGKMQEMTAEFSKLTDSWTSKLNDLKMQAERMVEHRNNLRTYLHVFFRNM